MKETPISTRSIANSPGLDAHVSVHSETNLAQRLAAIVEASKISQEQYEEQRSKLILRRTFLTEQIQTFQRESDENLLETNSITELIETVEAAKVDGLLSECIQHLLTQEDSLKLHLQGNLRHSQLEQERAALLASQPEIASQLDQYRNAELKWNEFESMLHGDYLKAVQEVLERDRDHLTPLLAIEDELAQFNTSEEPLHLDFLFCAVDQTQRLALVLPIQSQGSEARNELHRILDRVTDIVEEACLDIALHPSIRILEIDRAEWCGFATVEMQADIDENTATLVDTVRDAVNGFMTSSSILRRNLAINLVVLESEVWTSGKLLPIQHTAIVSSEQSSARTNTGANLEGDVTPVTSVQEESIGGESDSEVQEWNERPNRWFTSEDIRSWSRPLQVAQGSTWSIEARRVRTLLIRLIASGHVGRFGISSEDLLAGLPPTHRTALATAIQEMAKGSILLTSSLTSDEALFLNPSYLSEVEKLINRVVSAEWAAILRPV